MPASYPWCSPKGDDQNVYLVVDDLGRNGRVYREPTDKAIVVGCVVPVALADRARISTSMRSPAISAQTSDMSGNSWSRPAKRNARAVDASVTWNYTTWFNIVSLILAILFYQNKFTWDYKTNPHLTPVI